MTTSPVQEFCDRCDELKAEAIALDPVTADALAILGEAGDIEGSGVSVSLMPHAVRGILINVDNPTRDQLVALLRSIGKRKYKRKEIEDFPELGRRAYIFEPGPLRLQLFFHSWREGQSCKFVEVGKKEEPVYEFRCDGEPLPDEVPA